MDERFPHTSQPAFTPARPLRLGTRQSPLALAQANMVADAIRAAHGLEQGAILLVPMIATGDRILDRALQEVGGKALWTKELDRALAEREIDAAVHSMKDVETIRPATFAIAAMLPRADIRDRLVGAPSIAALPHGARVGTASPRRSAQLLALRPDLKIGLIRGNVASRLAKLDAGEFDATLLAAAGLDRLGMTDTGASISEAEMLPAPSQGAIGIEILADNFALLGMMAQISHRETFECVMAERHFLYALGADCHSPVAASARMADGRLLLKAEILLGDGSERQAGEIHCEPGELEAPALLASQLLDRASPALKALFAG